MKRLALLLLPISALAAAPSGQVLEWGNSDATKAAALPSATNIIEISANAQGTLVLRSDGSLARWGTDANGQNTGLPAGNQWAHISEGWTHSVAVDTNGVITEWGQPHGNSTPLADWNNFRNLSGVTNKFVVKVAAGDDHTAALTSDGTVYAWGGRALVTNHNAQITDAIDLSSGWYWVSVARLGGSVTNMGEHSQATYYYLQPPNNAIPYALTNIQKVFSSYFLSYAVASNGVAYAWGTSNNVYGEITIPSTVTNVVSMGGGREYSIAAQANGSTIAWGHNDYGQIDVPYEVTNAFMVTGAPYDAYAVQSSSLATPAGRYYVHPNGFDTDPGSLLLPWRTFSKALGATGQVPGNSIVVYGGGSGYAQNSSTVTNNITWLGRYAPQTHTFRVQHASNSFSGFVFDGAADANAAYVRIENAANYTGLTNNLFKDGHWGIFTNLTFYTNRIVSVGQKFTDYNFVAGDKIFIGADEAPGAYHTNHDTANIISAISADGLTITNTTALLPDAGTGYWAPIAAGQDNAFINAVLVVGGAGTPPASATNVSIVGNTFSNLFGAVVVLNGANQLVQSNTFEKFNGFYGVVPHTRNSTIRDNLFIHNQVPLHYLSYEIGVIDHPPGGSSMDYVGQVMADFNITSCTNNLFARNWIQDCENQAGQIEVVPGSSGFTFQSNVWVGVAWHGSISRDGVVFDHNTFVKTAYDMDEVAAMTTGGTALTNEQNLVFTNNAFIDVGPHQNLNNEVGFTVVFVANSVFSNNFIAPAETFAWKSNNAVTAGYFSRNGGDPVLVNIQNPLGPDGIPFTADDGLRPLPNSALAIQDFGALASLPTTSPIAHFSAVVTNWQDATGTNFNTAYAALLPHQRVGMIRPWQTPEAVGNPPITISFDASKSIDGAGTNNFGIRFYGWDFGDGQTALTPRPYVAHTFTTTGTNVVVLSITNLYGATSYYSNSYRTLITNAIIRYVTLAGNDSTGNGTIETPWRTIQHAATAAAGGWTVSVGAGDYGEDVDITQSAGGTPIRFVGYGAKTKRFNIRNPDYTFEGFDLVGATLPPIYVYAAAHRLVLRNNYIHDTTNSSAAAVQIPPGSGLGPGPTNAAHDCVISNNVLNNIYYVSFEIHGSNNLVTANIIKNTHAEGDGFRAWGNKQTISYNYCTNLNSGGLPGHPDCFQTFGNASEGLTELVFEGNEFDGGGAAVCQIEWDPNGVDFSAPYTNLVFRNNIYNATYDKGSVDCNGTKWYNNVFYRVNYANGGHSFAFGGGKGSAYGTEIKNNGFVACGNGVNNGWYPIIGDAGVTNWDLVADYNFVCTSNLTAYLQAPPNDTSRFKSDGQDAHGINGGDPKFVSLANNDFRLQASSPFVGAATSLTNLFTTDINGSTRGASWDIGPEAFSITAAPTPPSGTNRFWAGSIRAGRVSKP